MSIEMVKPHSFMDELEQIRSGLERELQEPSPNRNRDGEHEVSSEQLLSGLQDIKEQATREIRSGVHGQFDFGDVNLAPELREEVTTMLKVLVFPEVKVGEEVARRIPDIPDLDLKARASQQVIDEIRHARLLRDMLTRWGEDADELYDNPIPEIKAVFDYVSRLETVSEFFTANFVCEGLFLPSHLKVMADLDRQAFEEYIDGAMSDEAQHIALARDVIVRYATTAEVQERCRVVAREVAKMFLIGFRAKIQTLMEKRGSSTKAAS